MRTKLTKPGLWVIKIGSAVLTNGGKGLSSSNIDQWATQIANLKSRGFKIVLVSSGAVAEGMARLNWQQKPHEIYKQQAAAAVGQAGLIKAYETCFAKFSIKTAQILLTHDDIASRKRYLNAKSAINTLLDLGVVPIVNENDTVAVDEIRFGDNDSLAGLVVGLLNADGLLILTDQDGMFNKNPAEFDDIKLLNEVDADDKNLDKMASSKGGDFGKGGMKSKLFAARIAANSGALTIIANANTKNILLKIANGETVGTLLKPSAKILKSKSRWLRGQIKTKGKLTLDSGAVDALKLNKSLLAIGVLSVSGEFYRGDLVCCVDKQGNEIGRGLVNYNSQDATKIIGINTEFIEKKLGFIDEHELIHRDNLVIF